MKCQQCGAEQLADATVCTVCGASLLAEQDDAVFEEKTEVDEVLENEETVTAENEGAAAEEVVAKETEAVAEEAVAIEEDVAEETVAEEETVEEKAEDTVAEDTVEEAVQETEEKAVVSQEEKHAFFVDRLFSWITGGANILLALALFITTALGAMDIVAYSYGSTELTLFEVFGDAFGKNALGVDNWPYFLLVLVAYCPLLIVAGITGIVRLSVGITRVVKKPSEKLSPLAPTSLYSAAGIYAVCLLTALEFTLFRIYIDGNVEITMAGYALALIALIGLGGVFGRLTHQLLDARRTKKAFRLHAVHTTAQPDKKKIMANQDELRMMVRPNVLFYVTFGIPALVLLATLIVLLVCPILPVGADGGLTLFDLIDKLFSTTGPASVLFNGSVFEGEIDLMLIVNMFGQVLAGLFLVIMTVSIVVRILFRAVDFFVGAMVFGAGAQDRIALAEFLSSLCVKMGFVMLFAMAYGACMPGDFSLENVTQAALPATVLFVVLIACRIAYAVLGKLIAYDKSGEAMQSVVE